MKLMTATLATMMVTLTLAPMAAATDQSSDDGHLSRTFLSWGSIEFKPHSQDQSDGIGGVGWYNPDNRDELCLFRLFGFAFNAGVYYETLRWTTNAANIHALEIAENGIYGGLANDLCPFVVAPDQFLGTSAANVWISPGFSQSNLLCFKSFAVCDVDEDSVRWIVYRCDTFEVEFGAGDIIGITTINIPPQVKSITGNPTVGSSQVTDDCDGTEAFDLTSFMNPQLDNMSSLYEVHVDQVVAPGDGTQYVVSCVTYQYEQFPASDPEVLNASSHDYFLVTDASDAPTVWADAKAWHLGMPMGPESKKYEKHPDSAALQGFYDLSGNNGCPDFEPENVTVLGMKDKGSPVQTIPRVIGP